VSRGEPPPANNLPEPWRPRFSLGTMLLVMMIVCVIAAGVSYAYRAYRLNAISPLALQLTFLIFMLASPAIVMVVVSVVWQLVVWLGKRR
jgi:hypothetical protein